VIAEFVGIAVATTFFLLKWLLLYTGTGQYHQSSLDPHDHIVAMTEQNRFNTFQIGFFNPALLSILILHASLQLYKLDVELVSYLLPPSFCAFASLFWSPFCLRFQSFVLGLTFLHPSATAFVMAMYSWRAQNWYIFRTC
jgi:hypothetical protein